ncbi:hypothetical protein RRG08_044406 [Elysia crispata]|uniref:Uncharacterized protein n=1 Tax=Elysia crispata TaxID=231223 RepID=A0AAE0ZWP1_9GAST|nr:hypothetical protein RRG08_044406 [Elysia crispata]
MTCTNYLLPSSRSLIADNPAYSVTRIECAKGPRSLMTRSTGAHTHIGLFCLLKVTEDGLEVTPRSGGDWSADLTPKSEVQSFCMVKLSLRGPGVANYWNWKHHTTVHIMPGAVGLILLSGNKSLGADVRDRLCERISNNQGKVQISVQKVLKSVSSVTGAFTSSFVHDPSFAMIV